MRLGGGGAPAGDSPLSHYRLVGSRGKMKCMAGLGRLDTDTSQKLDVLATFPINFCFEGALFHSHFIVVKRRGSGTARLFLNFPQNGSSAPSAHQLPGGVLATYSLTSFNPHSDPHYFRSSHFILGETEAQSSDPLGCHQEEADSPRFNQRTTHSPGS